MNRILLSLIVITIIVFGSFSCKKDSLKPNEKSFTLNIEKNSTLYLLVGDTFRINIYPPDAKVTISKDIVPHFEDPVNGVVSISSDGTIKALEPGEVNVSVKNNGCSSYFNIIVIQLPKNIEFKDSSIVLKTGANFQLRTNIATVIGDYELQFFGGYKWEVLDNSLASISDSGKITALKPGETKVRVSLKNYLNISAEFKLIITNHIVYVTGEYKDVIQNPYQWTTGCYWKSGVRKNLTDYYSSNSYSIVVQNDAIFVAGWYNGYNACNWAKGIVSISNERSLANAISLANSDVYTCGNYYPFNIKTVCLWKNSTLIPIIDVMNVEYESSGNAISVLSNDIYIGGYIKNNKGIMIACYWKNAQRIDLSDGLTDASIFSMFIDGADIYASGWYKNTSGLQIACYWKNGTMTDLTTNSIVANSINVLNGNIYIAGEYRDSGKNIACYWVNSIRTNLSLGANYISGSARSIKVKNNDIYIAGFYTSIDNKTIACYWSNDTRMDLPGNNSLAFDLDIDY